MRAALLLMGLAALGACDKSSAPAADSHAAAVAAAEAKAVADVDAAQREAGTK